VVLLASVGPGCVNAWDKLLAAPGTGSCARSRRGGCRGHSSLWRTFLTEQRALVRELDELVTSVPSVKAPVLLPSPTR
jgi:hypothetical protein